MPLPRKRLFGCARNSPLSHFFIHHSQSSLRELHPFCSTTALATQDALTPIEEDNITIQFLFRKRGVSSAVPVPSVIKPDLAEAVFARLWRKTKKPSRPQWTDTLAGFANELSEQRERTDAESATASVMAGPRVYPKGEAVKLRLEGPYYTTANPWAYDTVVCVVAGTGVSGAMAITGAFKALDQQSLRCKHGDVCKRRPNLRGEVDTGAPTDRKQVVENDYIECGAQGRKWRRCIVVWSVRAEHYIDLPELTGNLNPSRLICRC